MNKYRRKNKISATTIISIDGIDTAAFGCNYFPAKRRGPVPGRNTNMSSKKIVLDVAAVGSSTCKQAQVVGLQHKQQNKIPSASTVNNTHVDNATVTFNTSTATNNYASAVATSRGSSNLSDLYATSQHYLTPQNNVPCTMAPPQGNMVGATTTADYVQVHATEVSLAQRAVLPQTQQLMAHYSAALSHQHAGQVHASCFSGGQSHLGNNMDTAVSAIPNVGHPSLAMTVNNSRFVFLDACAPANNCNGSVQMVHNAFNGNTGGNFSAATPQQVQYDGNASIGATGGELKPPKSLGLIHGLSSVTKYKCLLAPSSKEGSLLRSFYNVSVNELFDFPPTPSNEEHCLRLQNRFAQPSLLPQYEIAALNAARFSELALGALVNDQVKLALELSNASVTCLRECVEEPVDSSGMFDVARAYLLHAIFRSFRGDMERYFKFRRVCLTHVTQLDATPGTHNILSAISLHDGWVYMLYNADEARLPDIDRSFPPLMEFQGRESEAISNTDVSETAPSKIVFEPHNQMWIQGAPPIYLNTEAPPISRIIDALACAIRSCCDKANTHFDLLTRSSDENGQLIGSLNPTVISHTTRAVHAQEEELCPRKMISSAFNILEQEKWHNSTKKITGLQLITQAFDIFLENESSSVSNDGSTDFTDNQIHGLLEVANTIVENPLLLYHGGPTYHMMSNTAVLIGHVLNDMHARQSGLDEMEIVLTVEFEDVVEIYFSLRRLLNNHRGRMPLQCRCHEIPRPNLSAGPGLHIIDFATIFPCGSRACQGFILNACSPCVAAEREQAAALLQRKRDDDNESLVTFLEEIEPGLNALSQEFDLDDDSLLQVLSSIMGA